MSDLLPRGQVLQVFHGHEAYGDGRYVLLKVRADDDLRIGETVDMIVGRISKDAERLQKMLSRMES